MRNKYILICSDEKEGSTDIVCNWLNYFDKPFIRISYANPIRIEGVKIFNNEIDIEFKVKNKTYFLSQIESYWYRRSRLVFESYEAFSKEDNIDVAVEEGLRNEYFAVLEYFEKRLNEKAKLNKFIDNKINKLEVLTKASLVGLQIPNTLATRNKKDLELFNGSELITKAIGDFVSDNDTHTFAIMTNKICNSSIEEDHFFHTLFQDQIDKLFELRIFFIENRFYSSAIFSQSNEKTKVDFRNYDSVTPNRVIPFLLPESVKNKLIKLMSELNLKSGSIDMAYTKDEEYVFFEVNPVGQFEQVSFPCNYSIHKEIANIL